MSKARNKKADPSGSKVIRVHAPTATVFLLRQAASVIKAAAEQLPQETIFFPPKEQVDHQPVPLEGPVLLSDLAGLIYYIADMLEP